MASTTGPDSSFGRTAVERLMDDGCVITRPAAGEDVTLNVATGVVERPSGVTVYDASSTGEGGRSLADEDAQGGICKVKIQGSRAPSFRAEGGALLINDTREVTVPVDAPEVFPGDRIVITTSRRDPQLVTMGFRVEQVIQKTFAIQRTLVVVPG